MDCSLLYLPHTWHFLCGSHWLFLLLDSCWCSSNYVWLHYIWSSPNHDYIVFTGVIVLDRDVMLMMLWIQNWLVKWAAFSLCLPWPILLDPLFLLVLYCWLSKPFLLFFLNLPPGLNCTGGQRHHQLQATGYPPAGHPCQPVWLPHREGRGQDKGDQGGEHPEHKSSPCSMPTLHRKVHIWNIDRMNLLEKKLYLEGSDIFFYIFFWFLAGCIIAHMHFI